MKKKWNLFLYLFTLILQGCLPILPAPKNGVGNRYVPGSSTPSSPTSVVQNNLPRVAANQTISLNEDSATAFTVNASTDDDSDDTLSYYVVSLPLFGTLTNCMNVAGSDGVTDRTCTYTPPADTAGGVIDYFSYRTYDGQEYSQINSKIYFNISSVNDTATIAALSGTTTVNEGNSITLSTTVDEGGAIDENSQTLKVQVTSSDATVVLDTSGIVVKWGGVTLTKVGNIHTLNDLSNNASSLGLQIIVTALSATESGSTTITATVSDDSFVTSNSVTAALTFSEYNTAPSFTSLPDATVGENVAGTITAAVDEGASDPDEDSQTTVLTITSGNTSAVPNANIIIDGVDNSESNTAGAADDAGVGFAVSITPSVADYAGTVTFTATLSDGTSTTTDTFNITWNPTNSAATIADVTGNQTVLEDVTITSHQMTIDEGGGADENADGVIVCLSSSDTTLVPVANIVPRWNSTTLSCVAGACSVGDGTTNAGAYPLYLNITPGTNQAGGPATITVGIDDDGDCAAVDASDTFTVTVTAVDDAPTISVSNQTVAEGGSSTFNITIDAGGGTDENAQALSLTVTSGTPAVTTDGAGIDVNATVTNSAVALAEGAIATIISPNANAQYNGAVTFTAAVNDGSTTTSQTFTVTWSGVDDTPTISATADQTIAEDATLTITPTVDEGGTTAEDSQAIVLTVTSSDSTILDPADITASWNGNNLVNIGGTIYLNDSTTSADASTVSLVFNPEANANTVASGVVTITISVDDDGDGVADTSDDFDLTITAVEDLPTITAISGQTTNIDTGIYAVAVTLDEGGGTFEDAQTLTLRLSTSDSALFPYANIRTKKGATYAAAAALTAPDGVTYQAVGDVGTSGDAAANGIFIDLIPDTALSGSATITLTVQDSVGGVESISFVATVNNISVEHGGWSTVYAVGRKLNYAGTVLESAPTTTFTWPDFTYTNATAATSWNVYRSATGAAETDFNYTSPIATVTSRSFTDTSLTSADAGLSYWYQVRPVLDTITTGTSQTNYHSLRIVVPPDNMALVHRWAANIIMCGKISATVDKDNNFRCAYTGPGNIDVAGTSYYDFLKSIVVDRFEFGCSYGDTSACAGTGIGCLGVDTPNGSVTGSLGSLFYNRANAQCYINTDGATTWENLAARNSGSETAPNVTDFAVSTSNASGLPPFTGATQLEANELCIDHVVAVDNDGDGDADAGVTKRLLTRKEQQVAAQWSTSLTDTSISTYETGTSLNSAYVCNTNNGNGLTYVNTDSSATTLGEMLPGTNLSGIRSVTTGSASTANCVSRFGLQDAIGNVAEWSSDRVMCATDYSCTAVSSATSAANRIDTSADYWLMYTAGVASDYAFGAVNGPCSDSDNDGTCDSTDGDLTTWTFASSPTYYDATKFFIPLGLPADTDIAGTATTATIDTDITSAQLHSDIASVYAPLVNAGTTVANLGGMMNGGSYYTGGNGAGLYSFEFDNAFEAADPSVGFRCATPVDP